MTARLHFQKINDAVLQFSTITVVEVGSVKSYQVSRMSLLRLQSSAASTDNLADEIAKDIQADKPVKKTKKERSPAQKAAFEKAQAKLKEKRAAVADPDSPISIFRIRRRHFLESSEIRYATMLLCYSDIHTLPPFIQFYVIDLIL